MTKPVVLCILDGWGLREDSEANAVAQADTPAADQQSYEESMHDFPPISDPGLRRHAGKSGS